MMFIGAVAFISCFSSCKKNSAIKEAGKESQLDDVSGNKGSVQFVIGSFSNARTVSDLKAAAQFVQVSIDSVMTSGSKKIYDNKQIALQRIGGQMLSLPISLSSPATGSANYRITNFLVLDKNGVAIMGTPKSGTSAASLVSNPLDISISISKDASIKQVMQVVELTTTSNPQHYGYSTFTFDVKAANTSVLISPMYFNPDAIANGNGNYVLTPATITITQQNEAEVPASGIWTNGVKVLELTTNEAITANCSVPFLTSGSDFYRVSVKSTTLTPSLSYDTVLHKDTLEKHFLPKGTIDGKGSLIMIMKENAIALSSFDNPLKPFLAANGSLYVPDKGNKRILRFDNGDYTKSEVVVKTTTEPRAVVVGRGGVIYVADTRTIRAYNGKASSLIYSFNYTPIDGSNSFVINLSISNNLDRLILHNATGPHEARVISFDGQLLTTLHEGDSTPNSFAWGNSFIGNDGVTFYSTGHASSRCIPYKWTSGEDNDAPTYSSESLMNSYINSALFGVNSTNDTMYYIPRGGELLQLRILWKCEWTNTQISI